MFLPILGSRIVRDYAWDLSTAVFRPGVVYKTHALADELPRGCSAKVVFLFSAASESALSVYSCRDRYGDAWIAEHLAHMGADGNFDELGDRDILRFDRQIESWLSGEHDNVLGLRYETMWDNLNVLSDHVGFTVGLPPRQPRKSLGHIDSTIIKKFTATYHELDEKIAALPDVVLPSTNLTAKISDR